MPVSHWNMANHNPDSMCTCYNIFKIIARTRLGGYRSRPCSNHLNPCTMYLNVSNALRRGANTFNNKQKSKERTERNRTRLILFCGAVMVCYIAANAIYFGV